MSAGGRPGGNCAPAPLLIHWLLFNEVLLISAGLGLIHHHKQGDFDINALSSLCKSTNPVLSLFSPDNWNCDQHLCDGWGLPAAVAGGTRALGAGSLVELGVWKMLQVAARA